MGVDRKLQGKIKSGVKRAKRENTQPQQLLLSPNRCQRWNRSKNPIQAPRFLRIFAQTAFPHAVILRIKVSNATSFKLISVECPPHPQMPQIKTGRC